VESHVHITLPSSFISNYRLSCTVKTGHRDVTKSFRGVSRVNAELKSNVLGTSSVSIIKVDVVNETESESESELLYDWRFAANHFVLATSRFRPTTSNFIFQLNTCGYSPYVTSCLTRGWVCHLQLPLVLDSKVIFRFESRGTHDHILLSQIRDSPYLDGQVPVFISPRNRVAQLHPQALGSVFVASYVSQGYGGGIRPRLHTGVVNEHMLLIFVYKHRSDRLVYTRIYQRRIFIHYIDSDDGDREDLRNVVF
jgi:hypothetical protein